MTKKKFDVAIMNPPYDDLGNTLCEDIMFNVSKYSSETKCICPSNFIMSPYLKVNVEKDGGRFNKYKNDLERINDIKMINRDDFNKMFNIGGTSDGCIISLNNDKNVFFDSFNNNVFFKIIDVKNSILKNVNRKNKTDFHLILRRQTYSKNDINFIEDSDKHLNKDQRNFLVCYFDSLKEKENFIKCYNSPLMKTFLNEIKIGRTTPIALIPFMQDYSKPWTNERFCKYFDITGFISDTEAEPGSEWEEILKTMEKYK